MSFYSDIFIDEFNNKVEFNSFISKSNFLNIVDDIDDKLIYSRHPFKYKLYCNVCNKSTTMNFGWRLKGGSTSVNPAWTEIGVCEECKLNSRNRALYTFVKNYAFDFCCYWYFFEEIPYLLQLEFRHCF